MTNNKVFSASSDFFDEVVNDQSFGLNLFDQEDEDQDDLVDEYENESAFAIRGKWILDGSETLLEAAEMARAYADFLEQLHEEGFELRSAIEDDYGFAQRI